MRWMLQYRMNKCVFNSLQKLFSANIRISQISKPQYTYRYSTGRMLDCCVQEEGWPSGKMSDCNARGRES